MDRLVKADTKEVEMIFLKGQKCSSSFKLTNLMHTMSVAVSLTTTNSSLLSCYAFFFCGSDPFFVLMELSHLNPLILFLITTWVKKQEAS